MSNTKIQIKRSSVTDRPIDGSLSAGELAYSYSSDRLYVGTANSANVMEIGGYYWLNHIIKAYDQANTGGGASVIIFNTANAAFDKANSANVLAYQTGIGANAWTNTYAAAVGTAGNNYAIAIGAAANNWANTYAQAVGAAANNASIARDTAGNNFSVSIGAASNNWTNTYAQAVGTAGNNYSIAVGAASNNYANLTFLKLSGGSISGDVTITGNLTTSGTTTYANTQTLLIGDNIITLNADLPGATAPSENAGIEVNRGSAQANSSVFWNEGVDKWQFTSNTLLGSSFVNIASNTDVEGVAAGANGFATSIGASSNNWANTYAQAVGAAGNNYTNSVGTAGNNASILRDTAGNNFSISIGAASNNWANTYAAAVGAAANNASIARDTAGNNFSISIGAASNNWANTYAAAVGAAANTTVRTVQYGGTGNTTFTVNGVLIGNGTSTVVATAAGTEGQVLQASSTGLPAFGSIDCGNF